MDLDETMIDVSVSIDFDYSSVEYYELFEQSDVTAFQHPAWLSTMQRHVHSLPDVAEQTLVIRLGDGTLIGTLPLAARRVMGATIWEYVNLGLVDYALPTLRQDFWDQVSDPSHLRAELGKCLGRYDLLRIKHMPTNNPLLLRLFPNASMERADFSAHAAELGPDYDTWRNEAISKSERKHRDKKRRAMMRNGEWEMKRLYDAAEIQTAFEYMREFHKDRYVDRPGEDIIQNPDAFRFYVNLMNDHAESGFTRLYQFTYNNEIVAVQFGLAHNSRYYYLMMGVDYDKMGKYSTRPSDDRRHCS